MGNILTNLKGNIRRMIQQPLAQGVPIEKNEIQIVSNFDLPCIQVKS